MAFEEANIIRQKKIKPGQITFTNSYINLVQAGIPWEYVRFQHDSATVQLRIVEGTEENGFKVMHQPNGEVKVYCSGFIIRNYIPAGVYQLTKEQEPDSFTFEFVRPTGKYRPRVR